MLVSYMPLANIFGAAAASPRVWPPELINKWERLYATLKFAVSRCADQYIYWHSLTKTVDWACQLLVAHRRANSVERIGINEESA